MSYNRRRSPGVTGLFAAPVTPVTARPVQGDPVQTELAATIRGFRELHMTRGLKKLVDGDDAPVQFAGMPAAQSVGEVVRATVESAKAVADLHKGAAETALTQAKLAKEEAKEAKEEASGAYDTGLQEGRQQMTQLLQVIQQGHQTTLEMVKQMSSLQVEHLKSTAEESIRRLSETAQQALAAKDQQIAHLHQQLQTAQGKRSVEEEVANYILGRSDSPLLKQLIALSQPATADPNTEFQRALAPVLARVEGLKAERELTKLDAQEQRSAAIAKVAMETATALGDLFRNPERLASVLAALRGTPPQGAPQDGIPPTFEGGQTPPPAQASGGQAQGVI